MTVLADQLSDGIVLAAFVAIIGASLGFAGWVAREMYRTTSLLSRLEERSDDHDRRLDAIEAREAANGGWGSAVRRT